MTVQDHVYTAEEFEQFVNHPENIEKLFELIGGEIVEVPSNPYVSKIAGIILTFINLYLFDHKIGHVTGEAGGYIVAGERYAPDVAFISFVRQPELVKEGYNPNPPDLAVEVVSSSRADELHNLRIKVNNYLAVGTVVWVVKPDSQQVEVYVTGEPVKILRQDATIDGGDVLPGFQLKIADIFQA
jgi:Uma2 family endonuclease